MAWLHLTEACIALGKRVVLRGVTAEVPRGELVVIVGPNGAGKTTLLRAIAGLVGTRSGTIRVLGHDPLRTPRRVIAQELAYLPQHYELAFPFAVEEVVLLGRYAQQSGLGIASPDDLAAGRAPLAPRVLSHQARPPVDDLSGGERRRV
jgi:iron complex transport system ATP-binding protein